MTNINLSHQSDLMTNYMASSAVSASKPVSTILDDSGNPVIFSIGTNNELWVSFRGEVEDDGPQTGWVQYDLSTGIDADVGSDLTVVAFDTTQNAAGEFAISLATAPVGQETSSRVYVTAWLSNTMADTDWRSFASSANWVLRSAVIPINGNDLSNGSTSVDNAVANKLLIGEGGLSGSPLVVVIVDQGDKATHYFVNGDVADVAWSWAVYQMPQDAQEILDIAFGYMNVAGGTYGTYVLYTIDNITSLYFVSVVAPVGDDTQPYIHQLTAPEGAKCLASLADINTHFSNLYVGGSGVSFFSYNTQPQKPEVGGGIGTEIISGDSLSGIQELILAQDDDSVSVWVLDRTNQNLYYSNGPQSLTPSASEWSLPLLLQQSVAHMAAARNPLYQSNQIVTAFSNNSLGYQWQDPTTSSWLYQDVPLQDIGGLQSFTSYTSTINFTDAQDNSLINVDVSLSSAQWAYVIINGYAHEIGPEQSAELKTDANGNLTIINKTQSLNTPIYQVEINHDDGESTQSNTAQVNPAKTAIERLSKVQTGDDLKALFPDKDFSDDVANFGALTLTNLATAIAALPQDGTQQTDDSSTELADQSWGGYMQNGQLVVSNDGFSLANAIETVAGDVIRMLEAAISEIGQFMFTVAKGIIHFAVEIAGEVLEFTIKAIGDALSLINWVLEELLGISLEDIIRWLGFIFDWGDIVSTHKVFSNISLQTVNALQNNADKLQSWVDAGFDKLQQAVDGIGSTSLLPPSSNLTVNQIAESITPSSDSGQAALNSALYGSAGNFAYYQTLHGGVMQGPTDDQGSGSDALETFLTGPLTDMINDISDEIQAAVKQIVDDYHAGTLTVEEVIGLVTKTIIESLIELLKALADAMFAIIDEVMALVETMLFGEIQIPLLTSLYELVTDGSEMSLVDGMCLLAAIPSTVFYKTAAGEAPFANGTYGLDSAESLEQVFDILGVQLPNSTAASAKQAVSQGVSEAATVYSQIGGAWSVISLFVNSFAQMAQALSEGEIKFTSKVTTTMTILNLAGSIPLDSDWADEGLDLGVYGGKVVSALIDAIMFLSPRAATFAEEEANGAYTVVVSFWNLGLGTIKLIYDLAEQQPDGDELGWDLETYVQTVVGAISSFSSGVSAVAGDENPEVELPAMAIAGGTQFITAVLGLTRAVNTIENDLQFFNQ